MPYLHRKGNYVIFEKSYGHSYSLRLKEDMDETYVYNYFHDYMKNYYEERKERIIKRQQEEAEHKERLKQEEIIRKNKLEGFKNKYSSILLKIISKISNSKNNLWKASFKFSDSIFTGICCHIDLRLAKYWEGGILFTLEDIECLETNQDCLSFYDYVHRELEEEMRSMWKEAIIGKWTVRLLEVK